MTGGAGAGAKPSSAPRLPAHGLWVPPLGRPPSSSTFEVSTPPSRPASPSTTWSVGRAPVRFRADHCVDCLRSERPVHPSSEPVLAGRRFRVPHRGRGARPVDLRHPACTRPTPATLLVGPEGLQLRYLPAGAYQMPWANPATEFWLFERHANSWTPQPLEPTRFAMVTDVRRFVVSEEAYDLVLGEAKTCGLARLDPKHKFAAISDMTIVRGGGRVPAAP
jgi:hypothetical protein